MRVRAAVVAVMAVVAGGAGEAASQGPMTWSEFRSLERAEADHRVTWGGHAEAFGELYLPVGDGPHPVAVLVHGGCWQAIADVGYVSHLARAFVDVGWAVWTPEFRRIDQEGGAWPGILEDLAAGTDHLRDLAARFPLDLSRTVTVGHSSGGHLALWLAARSRLPLDSPGGPALRGEAPLPVTGVVALAAIADLQDFHGRGGGGCGADVVPRLLGADVADAEARLAVTSPDRLLPLGVPQLLVTGALDATVPAAHGEAWVESARDSGDAARLLTPAEAGHFEVVAPWTASFTSVWPEIRAFLASLSATPGDSDT